MKTLLVILIIVALIYWISTLNRKSRSPQENFWDKKRTKELGPFIGLNKFSDPKDVVERLSNAGWSDNTSKDEDKFQNLIDRCIDNGQRKKLAQLLEKAIENFPPHLQDYFFRDDYIFDEFIWLYAEHPDELIDLLSRDTPLARITFNILGKERIADCLSESLGEIFDKDGDDNFSKLKKKFGQGNEILNMAIEKFMHDHADYVAEVKEDIAAEKNLSEARSKGEARLNKIFKSEVPGFESYKTKQYVVFHRKGRKKDWFVRFHNIREIPLLEFKDGTKERIHYLDQIDQMQEIIIRSVIN